MLDKLLDRCEEPGLLKGKIKQRAHYTYVVTSVCSLTLLELVGETMRWVLDDAALVALDWLRQNMKSELLERYRRRLDGYRLPNRKSKTKNISSDDW